MQVASFQRWEYCKSGSLCEPFSCVLLPVLAHFSIFQSYAPRNAGITGFCCIASAKKEIKSARTVLIKAMISSFYQYHSGCVFYYRRIARKAEAGRGGSPRSINKSAMCPAMWRLTFSGGGRSVRLSANGCQPHRPNTALLFFAAGYHPGLLRTFREYS